MDSRTFQNDSDILSCKNFAFVDKVEDFQCVFCKGLYTKQFRLSCTHFICRDCKYIKRKGCPTCRYSHEVEIKVAIVHIESEILKLRVRCLNDNCGYINTLKDFQDYHHKICKFSKFSTVSKSDDKVVKSEDVTDDNLVPRKDENVERANRNVVRNHMPVNYPKLNTTAAVQVGPSNFVKNQVSRFGGTPLVSNHFQVKEPPPILNRRSFKSSDANLSSSTFIPRKAPIPLPKTRTKILVNTSYLTEDVSSQKTEASHLVDNQHIKEENEEIKEAQTVQNNILNKLLLEKTNAELNGKLEEIQEDKFEQLFQNTSVEQVQNIKEFPALKSNFSFQKDKKLDHFEKKPAPPPRTGLKFVSDSPPNESKEEDKRVKPIISENWRPSKENVSEELLFSAPKKQVIELNGNATEVISWCQTKMTEQEQLNSTVTSQLLDLNNNQRDLFNRNLRFEDELRNLATRYNKMEATLMEYNSRIDNKVGPMRDEMEMRLEEVLAKVDEQNKMNLELTKKIDGKQPSFKTRTEQMYKPSSPDLNVSESTMTAQQQNQQISTLVDSNELILQQLDEMKDDIKANSTIISMCMKRSEENKERMNEISVDVANSGESLEEIKKNLKPVKSEENQSINREKEIEGRKSNLDNQLSHAEINFADLKQRVEDISQQVNANEEMMNAMQLYVLSSEKSLAEESIVELAKEVEAVNDRVNQFTKQVEENILEMKEDYNEKVDSIKSIVELRNSINENGVKMKHEELESNLNRHKTSLATIKQQVENICNKAIANEANLNKFQLQVSADIDSTNESLNEVQNEVASVKEQVNLMPRQLTTRIEKNLLEMKGEFENIQMEQEAKLSNLKKILDESERETISNRNNFEDKFTKWSSDVVKWLEDNQDSFKKQVLNHLKSNSPISRIDLHPFHTLAYVWEIPEIAAKMNEYTSIYRSDLFPLPGYSQVAFGVLESQCGQFRLDYYSDNAPQAADKAPFKKVHPKITCVLRDLSDNETPKNVVRAVDCLRSKKMVHEKFDFARFICSNEMGKYVRNDAVIFEIHVETPSLASKVFSHNGVLFDVIANYGAKKRMAVEELELSQKSPYFYTSAEGYRVQVLVYLNAIGEYEGNGLTAAIRILTGENDLTLPNSLMHTVTFTIFNQRDPTKHLVRSFEFDVKDENIYIDFESNAVIEDEGFVKNDSLFYKVVIQKRGLQAVKKTKSAFKLFK